jgi:MFS family permease
MSRKRIILVTAGIMLSLFLASMESTVVATAMPTIVGQLGGLEHYSWVFSAYMLASTTTVPLYGKLSDMYGRRKLYVSDGALPDRLHLVRAGRQHDRAHPGPRACRASVRAGSCRWRSS